MDNAYTRKDINESTVELTLTIPSASFKKSYDLMLQDHAKNLNVKGFRKGKVPTNLIENEAKEMAKFETLEKLAPLYINTAITKEKLEPICPPEFKEIPKILEDIDVTFTINITILPKFKLGDMKKVKVKQETLKVEEKEVDDVITELKNSQKTKAKEVNEEWAKEIGDILKLPDIDNLEKLRTRIKESLQIQKDHYQMHQTQDKALKLAIAESKINIPQPAIQYEAQERERYFNEDMKQRGVNIDDFLKANNITLEKMRDLWQLDAKEAIESDVFLTLYADSKEVLVTEDELEAKIEEVKKSQPNADSSTFSNVQWREYMRKIERKEKAFRLFIEQVLGKEYLDSHN